MKTPKAAAALTKRALIDKANTTTLIAAAAAAFIVVFSLVASRALFSQATYQNRVISEKKKTLTQLNKNLAARDDLVKSYEAFEDTPQNILGGNPNGSASDKDGDNSKIVLDALPSKYDFPALTASLEKFATSQGVEIQSITGTDDEIAQLEQQSSSTPEPIPIVFQVAVRGAYSQVQGFVNVFEKSIRPMQVTKISLNGDDAGVTATIDAQTFYQPEKKLELRKKTVR